MPSVDANQEEPNREYYYSEQRKRVSDYKKIRDLGAGDYGTVIEVEDERNQKFALKSIDMTSVPDAYILLEREIKPTFLDHPNIVKCYDFWIEDTPSYVNGTITNKPFLYILLELCRKETLEDWISKCSLDERKRKYLTIFDDILDAVEYLHLNDLVHRDLKPSNIYFGYDDRVKVADFGTVLNLKPRNPYQEKKPNAQRRRSLFNYFPFGGERPTQQKPTPPTGTLPDLKPTAGKHTTSIGTFGYMAPEVLSGVYDHRADIFSLGVILLELITPTHTLSERSKLFDQLKEKKFPEKYDEEFDREFKLFPQMLSHNPNDRPNIADVKNIGFCLLEAKYGYSAMILTIFRLMQSQLYTTA